MFTGVPINADDVIIPLQRAFPDYSSGVSLAGRPFVASNDKLAFVLGSIGSYPSADLFFKSPSVSGTTTDTGLLDILDTSGVISGNAVRAGSVFVGDTAMYFTQGEAEAASVAAIAARTPTPPEIYYGTFTRIFSRTGPSFTTIYYGMIGFVTGLP